MELTQTSKPRVISYKRYSSLRQGRGHSVERQEDAAQKWCARKELVLDTSLTLLDKGKSGFTGANRHKGALKTLLDKIDNGEIRPGTYLLIEALDRLTREELTESVPLFLMLLSAGLVIVTLVDDKEWTKEGMNRDQSDFFYSIMLLGRGHEESLRKASMIRAKFEAARKEHKNIFGSAPGWLSRQDKNSQWTIVEDRADSVRKVFELAAQGYGSKAIAKIANEEKWPLPTRDTKTKTTTWHGTMPGRLLRLRSVVGEYEYFLQDYKTKQKTGTWRGERSNIIVQNYYPPIVDEALWYRARAAIDRKAKTPRRRDTQYFNIWSGLLRCGECGAMIQRKTETRGGSKAQLTCSNKISGVTECRTGAASKTDEFLLLDICSYAGAQLGLGYDKQVVVEEIDLAIAKLNDNEAASIAMAEAIVLAKGRIPAFQDHIKKLADERDDLIKRIAKNKEKLSLEPNSLFDDSYAQDVLKVLYEKSDDAKTLRADCNTRLTRAIDAIWHFAYDVAIVKYRDSNVVQTIILQGKLEGDLHPKHLAWVQGNITLPGLNEILLNDRENLDKMESELASLYTGSSSVS